MNNHACNASCNPTTNGQRPPSRPCFCFCLDGHDVSAHRWVAVGLISLDLQEYHGALESLFIPRDARGFFEECRQYDIDVNSAIDLVVAENRVINSTVVDEFIARHSRPTVQCLHGWDYDTTLYPETLASKVTTNDSRRAVNPTDRNI